MMKQVYQGEQMKKQTKKRGRDAKTFNIGSSKLSTMHDGT